MANFKITPTTTVAELKDQFSKEVGGVLHVYEGRSEAADSATLVSLGAKEGELECRTSRTVGKFEEAFQKDLNLKVKVYTKDNWVKVLDGITLATAAELPNGMTKAKMEEYLSYQRDEKEEAASNNIELESVNDTVINIFKGLPIIDIELGVVTETEDCEDLVDYAYDNFSAPGIGVVDYSDDWDSRAWVFVTDDQDEAMYPAFDFIKELKEDNFSSDEIIHFQAKECKIYGLDKSAFDLQGAIGCALNNALQAGKPAYLFSWDADVDKVLFRIRYTNGWASKIFFATEDRANFLECIKDEGFEKIIHNLEHPEAQENIPLEAHFGKEDKLARVEFDGKYGYINRDRQLVIPVAYDAADQWFKDGNSLVRKDGKMGVINEQGKVLIPIKYDNLRRGGEGLFAAENKDKWGYVNLRGELIVPFEYDDVDDFSDGLAEVKKHGKCGFIASNGEIVIEPKYGDVSSFKEGMCGVEIDGKWGFVNKEGVIVIPSKFDEVRDFEDGYACVCTDDKWGVINVKGEYVVEPISCNSYDIAHLANGYFSVIKSYDEAGIVSNCKWVVEPIYQDVDIFLRDGLILVKKDNKYGYINLQGEIVIPIKFNKAYTFKNGLAEVELNDDKFKIDIHGNRVE